MIRLIIVLSTLCFTIVPALAWPTIYPTGTTIYAQNLAYPGYVLFSPLSMSVGQRDKSTKKEATIYLINMRGDVVHRWLVPFSPLYASLQRNGNLLIIGQIGRNARNRPGFGAFWMGGAAGKIVEMTWDGKPIFSHEDLNMHHDVAKLTNGHYMYLTWERMSPSLQQKVRGGIKGTEFPGGVMFNDALVEVDSNGKTVWTWHANQHLDPQVDIIGPIYKREEWGHANGLAVLPNGNILLTSRALDSILIIDRKTGKIASRWGSPSYLDRKTNQIEYKTGKDTLGGPHAAAPIPEGLPGAGHILIYDNGLYKYNSRVVELDLDSRKVVWQSGLPGLGRAYFSDFMGSAQRLLHGNTLVCEGANGRFFQTTPQNDIVWEYVNPHVPNPNLHGSVFRIHQYPLDWCPQFKTLKPAAAASPAPAQNQAPDNSGPSASTLVPAGILLLLLGLAIWKYRRQSI